MPSPITNVRFIKGENEICIGVFKGEKIIVVAVNGADDEFIGYFEHFEKAEQARHTIHQR
jgi:hypothetical protein